MNFFQQSFFLSVLAIFLTELNAICLYILTGCIEEKINMERKKNFNKELQKIKDDYGGGGGGDSVNDYLIINEGFTIYIYTI